jgi:hypothetical protein
VHANETAAEHLARALEVLRRDADHRARELEVVRSLADVRARLGDLARAEALYQDALEVAAALGEPAECVALLLARLAETQGLQLRHADAIATARRGLLLLGDTLDSPAGVLLLSALSTNLLRDGEWPAAVAARSQLAHAVKGVGYFEGLSEAYFRLGDIAMAAIPDGVGEAMRWYARLEEMSREHNDDVGLARACFAMGSLLANNLDDPAQGLAMHLKCVATAAHIGHARLLFEGHMQAASLHAMFCDDVAAERHVRAGIVAMRRLTAGGARASFAPEYLEEIGDRYAKRDVGKVAAGYWREALAAGATEFLQRRLLKKLEEHYFALDDHAAFRALCDDLRPVMEAAPKFAFQRLYLEPASVSKRTDRFAATLPVACEGGGGPWRWAEYMEGSTFVGDAADGSVTIHAPCIMWNGGYPPDVSHLLHVAPLVFAYEVTIDLRAMSPSGGIYLEAAPDECIVVGKWPMGEHDIRSVVRRGAATATVSRGIILAQDRLHLRLEYDHGVVRTLCSADGSDWLLSAETTLASGRSPWVGVYGLGCYDSGRTTRFSSVRLLLPEEPAHGAPARGTEAKFGPGCASSRARPSPPARVRPRTDAASS